MLSMLQATVLIIMQCKQICWWYWVHSSFVTACHIVERVQTCLKLVVFWVIEKRFWSLSLYFFLTIITQRIKISKYYTVHLLFSINDLLNYFLKHLLKVTQFEHDLEIISFVGAVECCLFSLPAFGCLKYQESFNKLFWRLIWFNM